MLQPKKKETNVIVKDNTNLKKVNAKLFNPSIRNKTDEEYAIDRQKNINSSNSIRKSNTTLGWRKRLSEETKAIGDKARISLKPNTFDDYINPAVSIGNMASKLGSAPLDAEKSNSILPYITAIAEPLITGAIVGVGAKTNKQFVKNMVSPIDLDLIKKPIKKVYNKVATGDSAIPFAWKSPAEGLTQKQSMKMFEDIKQPLKLTEAEKVTLAEYQFDSSPFTGRTYEVNGKLRVNTDKRKALQNIIDKANPNFNNNTVLTRFVKPDKQVFDLNKKIVDIGERPTSFSVGTGVEAFGKNRDRIVISAKHSKKIQDKFLKNPYENLEKNTLDNIQDYTTLTNPSFTGKQFKTVSPLDDGFVSKLQRTVAEKEVIGNGFKLKQIGKVKNNLGGNDLIMKPKLKFGGTIKK